jgi:GNAT superfamily N-acetyltransferase
LLLAVAGVSSSIHAQMPGGPGPQPHPCLPFSPDNTIEWPSNAAYGNALNFRRAVVVDLDGDEVPESIVNCGGIAVVLWGVIAYDAPEIVHFPTQSAPTAVADLAVLPDWSGQGIGAVVMTDSRGVFLATHDLVTPQGTVFQEPVVLASGNWVNAAPIHVDDVNLDGRADVIGISADRRKIMTLLGDGLGGFLPGPTITDSTTLFDVVPFDWNHTGVCELVALSLRGLHVFDSVSGAQIATVLNTRPPGCLTRFHTGGGAPSDLLAWTRGNSVSGASELIVLGGQGMISEGPWALTFNLCEVTVGITPTSVLAGDYDGDGDQDLLLAHEFNRTAVMLINQGATTHFVVGPAGDYDVIPVDAATDWPGDVGIPAFAQLDDESLVDEALHLANPVDIVFPVSASARVQVFTAMATLSDRVFDGQPPSAAVIFNSHTEFHPGTNPAPGTVRLAFKLPDQYLSCDAVDLVLWRQPNPTAGVEQHAVFFKRYPMSDDLYQWIPVDFGFPTNACWDTNSIAPCFYAELRFVNTVTNTRSRFFTGGFRLRSCSTPVEQNYPYLTNQGITGSQFFLYEMNGLDGSGGSGEILGIYVPMSSQPPFDDGLLPLRGEFTLSTLSTNVFHL